MMMMMMMMMTMMTMMSRLSNEKLENNHVILFQLLPFDIAMLWVRYLNKYLS